MKVEYNDISFKFIYEISLRIEREDCLNRCKKVQKGYQCLISSWEFYFE